MEANTGAHKIGMSIDSQFEQGMMEVIRKIASDKYLEERPETLNDYLDEMQLAMSAASDAFQAVLNSVGKQYKDLIFDLEDKMNVVSSFEAEEKYIRGFVAGCRFLKQIEKSCGHGL
ncbi:hypothetical protein [Paenibacillus apiarius]|uniref:Uncharacterized protein n=1 Tax=Paenibacillus apiarius TaxID=46240 RepID=A0ABT4DYL7_9BACL|nr:hypothetical protein [Paenibacillus apiarius]MCY9513268.1 hypothetical protein [Paenibacillus apiarius]MCY9521373.1 hypothetical protein [Paenibacillus apiarius]MCY9554481.1 hypothetical protein [Paenibacillus apiarius]MCY9560684.1 hypothetical protein [Paenibacillus apiarius]MCY9685065.1 hypothetical protein [Paenibacillus apiarius]